MLVYNSTVVEMKRGVNPRPYRPARVRGIRWLLAMGILLLLAGPFYWYLAHGYSGELVLAQKIPADCVARGFDFGPVYLEQGRAGRCFISAMLPDTENGVWHTTFEVLDAQKTPVFREDELRFIGDYQFEPGQSDRYAKTFVLARNTGYYYFRFTAANGVYAANPEAPPVVEFAVRQGVVHGLVLWLPAAASFILGALFIGWAVVLINHLGRHAASSRAAARGHDGMGRTE